MKKLNKLILFLILCLTFNIKALANDLVITGGELGVDYTYEDGVVNINNSNNYEISMADGVEESSDQIYINYGETLNSVTLTLNNVHLKTDATYNIRINYPNNYTYNNDLKVNLILKGDNSLTAKYHPIQNPLIRGELTISSDGGSLTTEASGPDTQGYNDLNGSKVTLESGTLTMKNQIIMAGEGIYIKGGELNITAQDEPLYSNGEIIISGGNTTLTTNISRAIQLVGTNISSASGGLQIIGDANLNIKTNGTSSTGAIFAGTSGKEDILIDTTGKVNIESNVIGIVLNSNSSLTINNGTLNITGPSYGIYSNSAGSTITVNGGETEITSKSYGIILQKSTQKTITFGDEYNHKNYHGTEATSRTEVSDEEIINARALSQKYVLITPAYNIEYDLGNGSLEEGKENPTKYSRVDTFTLNNPTPNNASDVFIGWSGTDLDNITKDVTISENSTGNRSYVAHYLKHVDKVDATCEEDGNIEYYYDEASDKYYSDEALQNEITKEDTVIPATGHDWGEWEITKEPTYTETGLKTRKCKNDPSHIETEVIPMLEPRGDIDNPQTSFIGNVINNIKTNHNYIVYIVLSILSVAGIGYTVKTIKENR